MRVEFERVMTNYHGARMFKAREGILKLTKTQVAIWADDITPGINEKNRAHHSIVAHASGLGQNVVMAAREMNATCGFRGFSDTRSD
ncbi:MAG: hypothetical protein PXZ08_06825 [Actinomycetota bacterium]|nr:hypothetical protein [Actinomycetota bacterium]